LEGNFVIEEGPPEEGDSVTLSFSTEEGGLKDNGT
jgi:hypothetical protein